MYPYYTPQSKRRWQYFSVLSPPLGLGGIIRTLSITLPIFRHAIKVNIATVPVWQDHVGRGASILTMDMCPRQYGYGLPFRSQANANEKPILTKGNIAILPKGNIDSWKTIYYAVEKTQCGSFASSEFKVYSIVCYRKHCRQVLFLHCKLQRTKDDERDWVMGHKKMSALSTVKWHLQAKGSAIFGTPQIAKNSPKLAWRMSSQFSLYVFNNKSSWTVYDE